MRIRNLGQLNWRVGESKNGDLKGKIHEGKESEDASKENLKGNSDKQFSICVVTLKSVWLVVVVAVEMEKIFGGFEQR